MDIILYNCKDDKRKVNKTLTNLTNVECVVKEAEDIDMPVVTLKYDASYLNFNYCYIPTFNTYYFIEKKEVLTGQEINLRLVCDDLFTLRNDILSSKCHIIRSTAGNKYIPDSKATRTNKTSWQSKKIGSISTSGNYYIMVKGGK